MNQLATYVTLIYLCNNIVNYVNSSKIFIVPIQRSSHMIQINAIWQELRSRGHEVGKVGQRQIISPKRIQHTNPCSLTFILRLNNSKIDKI